MNLEEAPECDYDSVTLYDGSDDRATSLGKFCNKAVPSVVSSTGSYVLVVFSTDGNVHKGRFSLSWKFTCTKGWLSLMETCNANLC